MARDMSFQDSSSEGEISLPIHYRKRKFRSYISGKLCRINRYSPPSPITTRSCKIPERKKPPVPEICQSWSCGEVFEEKSRLRDALARCQRLFYVTNGATPTQSTRSN
ncbi:TBC1 domain family member 25 [Trichonephila clavata]|uniref:TBC1 domain family member 25 n=1 Tax=Trichonephila clavata TaxID=2740835 RepID=A0A8X6JNP9_TRICU|nr:TBC1 domain family member 25 [Trichonephila clavata]